MSTIASAKSMAKMDKAEAGMEMKMREQATTRMLKIIAHGQLQIEKTIKTRKRVTNEGYEKCEEKILECSA